MIPFVADLDLAALASTIATTFMEFHTHIIGQDTVKTKSRFNQARINLKKSQVLTPCESIIRRFTHSFYQCGYKPFSDGVRKCFYNNKIHSEEDVRLFFSADNLSKNLRTAELSKQIAAPGIIRKKINGHTLTSINKVVVPRRSNHALYALMQAPNASSKTMRVDIAMF